MVYYQNIQIFEQLKEMIHCIPIISIDTLFKVAIFIPFLILFLWENFLNMYKWKLN